jgi:hypothetical protein
MNERELQAYASLAEVVSALAIIVSLLYVGFEFRRTRTMSSREADVVLYERLQESNRMLVETPGLNEVRDRFAGGSFQNHVDLVLSGD